MYILVSPPRQEIINVFHWNNMEMFLFWLLSNLALSLACKHAGGRNYRSASREGFSHSVNIRLCVKLLMALCRTEVEKWA